MTVHVVSQRSIVSVSSHGTHLPVVLQANAGQTNLDRYDVVHDLLATWQASRRESRIEVTFSPKSLITRNLNI